MNTSEFLNISNLIVPDRIAIIFEGQKTSYSDLFNRVIILANSLKSIGIEGRKNVLKKFDVDKMCLTTFTEYKKLIELS